MEYAEKNDGNTYFEVFDKDKHVKYGITSQKDMEEIRQKHPNEYAFEKCDSSYVNVKTLETGPKVTLAKKGILDDEDILFKAAMVVMIVSVILSMILMVYLTFNV